ncbi:unnamed protein product [Didymodactylos carnosus]|uniref:Uncharacterized protein n=1 Tax=Didymodactylos carnosus TaxID=1234261 RepID=A0A815WCW5_9BILA|nr:unnamed protein product [Didymodactylos carnosus]CAF1542290.1 unnamed protein product [Didymodactylos carnosus]CAF3741791.1 unnamed protein product [Didymodactylos carnosus]CAF4402767.1 unnamed protein product [Didymodactylos carnosus]
MQRRRLQYTLGFYRQLNNTGLKAPTLTPLHNVPVPQIFPQPPRLSSIQPLIQRFIFRGATAKRDWQKNKPFFITKHQYKQLKLSGKNGLYKPSQQLLNALGLDLQFHDGRNLHEATQIQFRIIKQKKRTYATGTTPRRSIDNIFVLYIRFIRAASIRLT